MKKGWQFLCELVLSLAFLCVSVPAAGIEWRCDNCGVLNQPESKFCGNCGEPRIYKENVNEPGRIDFIDDFFWDNSQGGISENFMLDFNTLVVSTNCISFYFPESWKKGIQFQFDEKSIRFFCQEVYLAEGDEDGLLCMIYREEEEIPEKELYYIGTDGEYWYYFETSEGPVKLENETMEALYEEQQSELDIIRDSFLIEGEQK